MKSIIKRAAAIVLAAAAVMLMLCSCGSDLDGTWTSQANSKTKITFSGDKVNVSYDKFKTSGTYESNDDGNIVITLTDKTGNKYKITAELIMSDEKTLTLKNADGEMEVFKK